MAPTTSPTTSTSSVTGGGTELTGNSVRLDAPGASFLTAGTDSEAFNFNLVINGAATSFTATVKGATSGINESSVLSQLNGQLNQYGINAQVGSDGQLQFAGSTPFTVNTDATAAGAATIATNGATATNLGTYNVQGAENFGAGGAAETTPTPENLTFQNGQQTVTVALTGNDTLSGAIANINAKTAALGIYAVQDAAGTGISFQSSNNFTVATDAGATTGVFAASGAQTVTAPSSTASTTGNALAAVTAITKALAQLGNVQARVGAGENKLQYAIDLANSQITNFSSAESQIRDADIATEAANLSKAQVLEQASVAAMAQANSSPQAILKLLQ
jgi:flagellin